MSTTLATEKAYTTSQTTTLHPLPPMILSNIRYEKNADHYWSFKNVTLQGSETLVGMNDKGSPSTIAIQAFRSFGKDAHFYPLDVEQEAIKGVRIVGDSVSDKALEFDTSKASCIKLADFTNPAILPMNFLTNASEIRPLAILDFR